MIQWVRCHGSGAHCWCYKVAPHRPYKPPSHRQGLKRNMDGLKMPVILNTIVSCGDCRRVRMSASVSHCFHIRPQPPKLSQTQTVVNKFEPSIYLSRWYLRNDVPPLDTHIDAGYSTHCSGRWVRFDILSASDCFTSAPSRCNIHARLLSSRYLWELYSGMSAPYVGFGQWHVSWTSPAPPSRQDKLDQGVQRYGRAQYNYGMI